jgi:hypothetical protein
MSYNQKLFRLLGEQVRKYQLYGNDFGAAACRCFAARWEAVNNSVYPLSSVVMYIDHRSNVSFVLSLKYSFSKAAKSPLLTLTPCTAVWRRGLLLYGLFAQKKTALTHPMQQLIMK